MKTVTLVLSLLSLTITAEHAKKFRKKYVKRYRIKRPIKGLKNDKPTGPMTASIQITESDLLNVKKDASFSEPLTQTKQEVENELQAKQAAQSVAIVDIMVDQTIEQHSSEGYVGFPVLYKSLAKHAFIKRNQTIPVQTMKSAFEQRAANGFRSTATPFFNLDDIWNYGCFCRFGRGWRKSHGKPVNEIDKVCQSLYFCYKCIEFDSIVENDDACDSVEDTRYNAPVASTIENYGSYVACSEANEGELCKIRKCCCDVAFALKLLSFFFDPNGVYVDSQYKHDGGWDPSEHCPTCQGQYCNAEKDCCGTYPDRFPYAPRDGQRGCCYDRTYNTGTMECCASDMTVKRIGQCSAPSYP